MLPCSSLYSVGVMGASSSNYSNPALALESDSVVGAIALLAGDQGLPSNPVPRFFAALLRFLGFFFVLPP